MTVSARKFVLRDLVLITCGILLLIGAAYGFNFLMNRNNQSLVVRGSFFEPEIVSSKEDLTRGLSSRSSIDRNSAMVFEFDAPGQHCMWMKDMKFAIDMVWLDESRKVTAVEPNVEPGTYPTSFCHEGKTVVEFAAGTTDRLSLYTGDQFRY